MMVMQNNDDGTMMVCAIPYRRGLKIIDVKRDARVRYSRVFVVVAIFGCSLAQ